MLQLYLQTDFYKIILKSNINYVQSQGQLPYPPHPQRKVLLAHPPTPLKIQQVWDNLYLGDCDYHHHLHHHHNPRYHLYAGYLQLHT